jgi:hypothetical protein
MVVYKHKRPPAFQGTTWLVNSVTLTQLLTEAVLTTLIQQRFIHVHPPHTYADIHFRAIPNS